MHKTLLRAGLLLPAFIVTQFAFAVDATTELLAKKGVITAEEYAKIKAAEANKATVEVTGDGLKISSPDKTTSAQIGTMLQMDYAGYSTDIADSKGRDLANSGTEFRRVRLYMNGTFISSSGATDWDYKTEIDFANGAQLVDGFVTYKGWQPMGVTVGHFKIPFSQESLAADKGLIFMERSLPNAFLNSRAPGVMLAAGKDNWSAAGMVFGEQLTTAANALSDESTGGSFRATWAPLLGPEFALHLRAAVMERIPSQANLTIGSGNNISYTETVRFRAKPESNILETRLIDTGATGIIDVENTQLWGAELGASTHNWLFNAEYINTSVARRNGKADLEFSGWYAQGAWTITGEDRSYQGAKGLFDGVKPAKPTTAGGYGAWELALRLSELDLSDGKKSLVAGKWVNEINGGAQRNLTLALNWYLTNALRISTNYVKVLDLNGGAYDGRDLDAVQMRFQFAY